MKAGFFMLFFKPSSKLSRQGRGTRNKKSLRNFARTRLCRSKKGIPTQSSYKIASQFYTTRLRRFSTLANLLLLEGLGDLLEGPNLVQSPFIGVPPATGGRRITTIISRKETFILPRDIFRPPGWQLHIALPIWPFGPGKRLLSPSNVR